MTGRATTTAINMIINLIFMIVAVVQNSGTTHVSRDVAVSRAYFVGDNICPKWEAAVVRVHSGVALLAALYSPPATAYEALTGLRLW